MRPAFALVMLAALAAGVVLLRRPVERPAPAGQRLVDLLAEAREVPPTPEQAVLFHAGPWVASSPDPVAVLVPVEQGRRFIVRARLGVSGVRRATVELRAVHADDANGFSERPAPLKGLAPGTALGPCLEQETNPRGWYQCQRSDQIDAPYAGLLIVISNPDLGIEQIDVLDTSLEELRRPASPLLGPLVRRAQAGTALGFRNMTGLAAPPEGRYLFDVRLPPDQVLRLSIGHEPGANAAAMEFEVTADDQPLFKGVVPPDGDFHDFEWKLPSSPRARIGLQARAAPGSKGAHRGLWLTPRVMGRTSAPNIVLFTMDAVRADHLSAWGYGRDTSPNLDRLLKFGTRFDASTAQAGSTWESMTSLLTGLYPAHTGVHGRGQYPGPDLRYLPDLLTERGYETIAGGQGADFPWTMLSAFDEFEYLAHPPTPTGAFHDVPPELVEKQVAAQLKRVEGRPFFLWIHSDQAHYPLRPSEPLRYNPGYQGRFSEHFTLAEHEAATMKNVTPEEGKQLVALYDASVRDTDAELGAILKALLERGALENTIIVVTADHGEVLGRRSIVLDHTMPFDDVLHVPLAIAWPLGLTAQPPVLDRVQSIDLAPSLLALAGLPPASGLDGRDLGSLLHGGKLPPAPAYSEVASTFSMYEGNDHFVFNPKHAVPTYAYRPAGVFVAERELYDVAKDPEERHDLAATNPGRVTEMERRLRADIGPWLETDGTSPGTLGQDALDMLRQAGYLQAPAEAKAP